MVRILDIYPQSVDNCISKFNDIVTTADLFMVLFDKRLLSDYIMSAISTKSSGDLLNRLNSIIMDNDNHYPEISEELQDFLDKVKSFNNKHKLNSVQLIDYTTYILITDSNYKSSSFWKKYVNSKNAKAVVSALKERVYGFVGFNASQVLMKYGEYLSDPLSVSSDDSDFIGRDDEIDFIFDILCQQKKNNPVLVGYAGVGKTAVVEELSRRIESGKCPDRLKNHYVFSLDVPSLISGAKYRGDIEQRVSEVLTELKSANNIILFIDEIHQIMGLGSNKDTGSVSFSEHLKPFLARENSYIIGATTNEEYKMIEEDEALARRFSKVIISEVSRGATLQIMHKCAHSLEIRHGRTISDDLVETLVDLCEKLLSDQYFPDKSLDIMMKAFSHSENKGESSEVTIDDIEYVFTKRLNVPKYLIKRDELFDTSAFYSNVSDKIIGQDEAITEFLSKLRTKLNYRRYFNKPIASFMFVGGSGVGKTEICKQFAEYYVNKQSFIKIDMTEYQDEISINRLTGSSAGYVGYEDGSSLIDKVRTNPYSVIVFDEIEKANAKVFNLLLQILDDGILTGSNGKTANFRNCIIILTSNCGNKDVLLNKSVGFIENTDNKEDIYRKSIEKQFPVEFINRIDSIIYFKNITKQSVQQIVDTELNDITEHFKQFGISVKFTDDCKNKLYELCYNEQYNARFIKRTIDESVYSLIVDSDKKNITIDYADSFIISKSKK